MRRPRFSNFRSPLFAVTLICVSLSPLTAIQAQGKVSRAKPSKYYQVTDGDSGLTAVSVRLYGTTEYWKSLADLNHIKAPFTIREGRLLKLPRLPVLNKKEGEAAVTAFYHSQIARKSELMTAHNKRSTAERSPASASVSASNLSPPENREFSLTDQIELLRLAIHNGHWNKAENHYQNIVGFNPELKSLPFLQNARAAILRSPASKKELLKARSTKVTQVNSEKNEPTKEAHETYPSVSSEEKRE